jgi:WD40 repeat protein
VNRRAVVLGGLAVVVLAADSAKRVSPRASQPRGTVAAAPTIAAPATTTQATATPTAIAKARVVTTAGTVDSIAFNPRGGTLASTDRDGFIRLWDTTSWINTDSLPAGTTECAISFSPDGRTLASGDSDSHSRDPIVKLWDLATKRATTLPGQSGYVFSVAFSRDGKSLASASPMDTVAVWDVARRSRTVGFNAGYSINALIFNRDANAVAVGCDDGSVQLLGLPSGVSIASFQPSHLGHVESVAFSPDWAMLASCGADKTVRLWNVALGSNIAVLLGHTDSVKTVAFNPDGKTLASAGDDATIRIRDLRTLKTTAVLQGHTKGVTSVAFSPDGKLLASGSWDTTIRLWPVPQ